MTEYQTMIEMLDHLRVYGTRGSDGSGKHYIGIGEQELFHSRSTRGDFVEFTFDKDGRLIKMGIYKNFSCEPEIAPLRGFAHV